jgi:type III restriction enzyme
MSNKYLYETLEGIELGGYLKDVPESITENLSPNIKLRDYQIQAFRYFITYSENNDLRKNKQLHTLFHMATGSGKTVMMAGLIFYLYEQGYRNFLFFVNQTNILEKTKENFLNQSSGKYLFTDSPTIFGQHIPVHEVENFSYSNTQAINLCFTTTQQLHYDLNFSKENSLTIEDFEDNKVVLISDESHHINTRTKLNKTEEEEESSWEYSVERIFRANRENILLEFTATADLKDYNVRRKYLDKIIFDYPLAKFRASGYTKDFQNLQSDTDFWQRTLIALILSEYRLNLFADCSQNVKPVILLKSQYINESQAFYETFFARLNSLQVEEIETLSIVGDELFHTALSYFGKKDQSLQSLVAALKQAFSQENAIIMNGSTDNTTAKQLAVNSLEEHNNPYRIIFTVDMLNEGWDVLNLFDIVRLYDTRQGSGKSGKPGSYTIKEAQLIGRGARYCPFVAESEQERFKRKYDYDLTNPNRILETMLYHSKQDSRYITELRQALRATGLLPDDPLEIEYRLKEEFKESDFFHYGIVFSNRKKFKRRSDVLQVDNRIKNQIFTFKFGVEKAKRYGLFEDYSAVQSGGIQREAKTYRTTLQLNELPLNILYGAADFFEGLKFNVLKSRYPNLKSVHEFLTTDAYVGQIRLNIESTYNNLKANELFTATRNVLQEIDSYVLSIKQEYCGSLEFYEIPIKQILRDKKIYLAERQGEDGLGNAQSSIRGDLAVNLKNEDWFVYEENYGTSEEKAFVKYFSYQVDHLREQYSEIYLVRNERIADFAIYDFDTGERFEPDFLLFLKSNKEDGYEQQQIYIEPKGDHLLEKDAWKQDFLLRIEEEGIPYNKYVDDNYYRIIGLPFYNKEHELLFDQVFRSKFTKNTNK